MTLALIERLTDIVVLGEILMPLFNPPIWIADEAIELPKEFQPLEPCGQGAYGFVFTAEVHSPNGTAKVAIKKMGNVLGKETTARRFLRELIILRHMSHDNILHLIEVIMPTSKRSKDIYVVYEMMDCDLGSVLKSKQRLSPGQKALIFYQLMRGLKYMHSVGVMHRDIKPRNLLVNANCDLKICDLGLARLEVGEANMTDYACTRWYRAPEMVYHKPNYDKKVDIFSAACVFCELISLKPLLPGSNSDEQLELILRRLGRVADEDILDVPPGYYKTLVTGLNHSLSAEGDLRKHLFGDRVPGNGNAINLIRRMLHFNQNKRPNAVDILRDPLFGELRMEEDEPACESDTLFLDWDAGEHLSGIAQIRAAIYQEGARIRSIRKNYN